ncbi:MAG TPA: hypothetical protein VH135_07830 [Steroidobacteraceae bacterium]|nr:hypothetical protein [Steroidobacteraceae bacterium]
MMRSLLLSAALALLVACATVPPTAATATAAAKPPVGCVGQTATRIPVKDPSATCAGFGSTYTKQDIDNTGQTTLDRALPMLDPAITRH